MARQWVEKESSSAIITRALCSVIKTGKKEEEKEEKRAEIVFPSTQHTQHINKLHIESKLKKKKKRSRGEDGRKKKKINKCCSNISLGKKKMKRSSE